MLDGRREAVEAAADVLRQQAEHAGDLRRELADAQLVVEEDDADVDARAGGCPCRWSAR